MITQTISGFLVGQGRLSGNCRKAGEIIELLPVRLLLSRTEVAAETYGISEIVA